MESDPLVVSDCSVAYKKSLVWNRYFDKKLIPFSDAVFTHK